MVASDGLTRTIWVVHPPPSAKCGKNNVSDDVDPSVTTGRVVIRNSHRSFVKPRSATTATGTSETKVNDPFNGATPLNGD